MYNKETANCICSYHLNKKSEAGATAAVELLDEIGKAVVTDNPSDAASWFKNSTGNVLAKLLLTCCPIRDRGGT